MEGSRRGKGSREKGLPTPNPPVDGGNGVKKIIVYNTKKEKKEGTQKKTGEKKDSQHLTHTWMEEMVQKQ